MPKPSKKINIAPYNNCDGQNLPKYIIGSHELRAYFLINIRVNERVRNFFLGDDEAWEEILDEMHYQTADKLASRFRNLPEAELYDCFADWQTEFYAKVKFAQAEAMERAAISPDHLSAADFENLMIECCEEATKFRLSGVGVARGF